MWKLHLKDIYTDLDEWIRYDSVYNLVHRLGYDTPEQAWLDNPVIEGSANPKDFKVVK